MRCRFGKAQGHSEHPVHIIGKMSALYKKSVYKYIVGTVFMYENRCF